MKTPSDSPAPARSFKRIAWTAVRLAAGVVFLTAAGCPLAEREQAGDADLSPGTYEVRVVPSIVQIAPPNLTDPVPPIPLTIYGECRGQFDPIVCAAYQPSWKVTPGRWSSTVSIPNPAGSVAAATIDIGDPAKFFEFLREPNVIYGNTFFMNLEFGSATAPPFGTKQVRAICTVRVVAPGPGEREEAPAGVGRLTTGQSSLSLIPYNRGIMVAQPVFLQYTGPPTTMAVPHLSTDNPDKIHVTGFSVGERVADDAPNVIGQVSFVTDDTDFTVYKATLTLRTADNAVAKIEVTARR